VKGRESRVKEGHFHKSDKTKIGKEIVAVQEGKLVGEHAPRGKARGMTRPL
jgi:hypothetical protein